MTTQDNNETVGATAAFKHAFHDANQRGASYDEAVAAGLAASAGQSSTPVPRVGGPDESKPVSSDLAHVARQESGAVAEGVDTALPEPLTEVRAKFRGEWDYVEAGDNYYNMAKLQAYGAQQREAGRRDMHEANTALLNENCVLGERLAELARQPVSEGLTEGMIDWPSLENKIVNCILDGEIEGSNASILVRYVRARVGKALGDFRAILSAVPPAKAEGMSDTEQRAIIKAVQQHLVDVVRSFGDVSCAAYISTYHKPEQIAAILAQQAKGEQQ